MSDKVLIERELLERIVNAPSLTDEGEAIDKLRARLAAQPEASDVINGVPRKLLERAVYLFEIGELDGATAESFRALLAAQPQASRCPDCGYLTSQREHLGCLRKAVADLDAATGGIQQASAAQSASAVEREAVPAEKQYPSMSLYPDAQEYAAACGEVAGWNACRKAVLAAWQRTQSAGVPEGQQIAMQQRDQYAARVETLELGLLRIADDYQPSTDAEAPLALAEMREAIRGLVLAAAPAQPAAQDDDLLLELEDLRESLETARHNWRAFEDRCGDLQVENGKLRDRIAAAQDQGEVQRLREALEIAENCLHYNTPPETKELIRAALAASTGQEVKP